jgi:spermidine synthase
MIGLGSGSWARVVANYPSVNHLTVVEINPGYKEIIAHYPEFQSLFHDPRVKIIWDDGRRWLRMQRSARFDLIVMNTSYNWRSHATNLLSKEFLELCRSRMNTGGVILFNATSSLEVAFTAACVFKHTYFFYNSIVGSDKPLDVSPEKRLACLMEFQDFSGKPFFDVYDPIIADGLSKLAATPIPDISKLRLSDGIKTVTDDSMSSEFPGWHHPKKAFSAFFANLGKGKTKGL